MNRLFLRKITLLVFTTFVVSSITINCANVKNESDKNRSASTEPKFNEIYQEAEEAYKQAATLGNEWRDTEKFLESSKKAAMLGDLGKGTKLASKAKDQYAMAAAQVASNAKNLQVTPFYDPDATPEEDVQNIQNFFRNKFPNLPDTEFANGFYAMDADMRMNWEAIEDFPPYIPTVEEGEKLWKTSFKNGNSYTDCFSTPRVMTLYPRWNKDVGEVETLPMAINKCRQENGEKKLQFGKSDMLALQAYIAYQSRGSLTHVEVPIDDPRALEAYKQGKKFYFSRRGQLNLACYHCHFDNAGNRVRANVLGPAMGQTTHWPTYRSKWGGMGSLHRRYKGCNKQVRAKPFDLQSAEYRNLEYFHTFLSNGIPVNGPGARF